MRRLRVEVEWCFRTKGGTRGLKVELFPDGADLLQQSAQPRGVASHAAKSRLRINLREFANSRRQARLATAPANSSGVCDSFRAKPRFASARSSSAYSRDASCGFADPALRAASCK